MFASARGGNMGVIRSVWVLLAVVVASGGAQARDGAAPHVPEGAYVWDFDAHYVARHTREAPDTGLVDNDILRTRVGVASPQGLRFATELGWRVASDRAQSNRLFGVELQVARAGRDQRQAVQGRWRFAEDQADSWEASLGQEWVRVGHDAVDVRLIGGVQTVSSTRKITDRSRTSAYALGEFTVYPWPDTALRAGVMGDADGDLMLLGIEQKLWDWPLSLYIDYAQTARGYRGLDGYNDLAVGIRFVLHGGSLKAHHRASQARLFYRPVEVQ